MLISDVCTGRRCLEENTCARNGNNCQCSTGLRFAGVESECIGMISMTILIKSKDHQP